MTNAKTQIKFMSEAYCGSSHDYSILKTELPPGNRLWFDEHHLHLDLGFQGLRKDYMTERISIPFKKPKNDTLTENQKSINKRCSSIRVKVEHSIGGLKRYRFLSDRLRCRNIELYNLVAGICAALWNYSLTN